MQTADILFAIRNYIKYFKKKISFLFRNMRNPYKQVGTLYLKLNAKKILFCQTNISQSIHFHFDNNFEISPI